MKIELENWTRPHPNLKFQLTEEDRFGDPSTVWPVIKEMDGGLFTDTLCEFAGRICYRSQERMGKSPSFIMARLREGHEDIIEHVSITLKMSETLDQATNQSFLWGQTDMERFVLKANAINKHVQTCQDEAREIFVTANARTWRELIKEFPAIPLAHALYPIAPEIFGDLTAEKNKRCYSDEVSSEYSDMILSGNRWQTVNNVSQRYINPFVHLYDRYPNEGSYPVGLAYNELPTTIKVTHLGTNLPDIRITTNAIKHASSTFLIEGISRACTHQIVRHRRASYSQESQRYVDLQKANWNMVMPVGVAANAAAMEVWKEYTDSIYTVYQELRSHGVHKEDARFVLPNATETRLVVTMPHDAWKHFVWLRALDRAAQWEIRLVGQVILTYLSLIHPKGFDKEWAYWNENKESLAL